MGHMVYGYFIKRIMVTYGVTKVAKYKIVGVNVTTMAFRPLLIR
jgi:hypothetical protein